MVRREQWEKIINRLENFRAVPIWESGNSVIVAFNCVLVGEL
jgi:hypothetical protein